MKRHRLLGALIVFLIATSALAPVFYHFRAADDAMVEDAAAQAPAPALLGPSAFAETTEAVWSCEQFGGFSGLRGDHRERVCGKGPARHAGVPYAAQRKSNDRNDGPLKKAVMAAIAGSEAISDQALDAGELAMAIGAGAGPNWGAPQVPGGGGLPGNLLANLGPTSEDPETPLDPENPLDPEMPVVPLPGALPLMLTGFAALLAAKRRRSNRAS